MAYTTTTLDQFAIQLGVLLDDAGEAFWTRPEKYFVIWEALRYFGATTNFWRNRGTFPLKPSPTNPWYDLSAALPALRTRTWTLGQMVQEIQYMLLEAPNGISGAGMSGQVTVTNILNAIQRARNRLVLEAQLPLSVHSAFGTIAVPDGMVTFPQASVFVHRASWMDQASATWNNLWRQDAWAVDKGNQQWTTEPGNPQQYSEAENAPLMLQLSPPPQNIGQIEALTVDSLVLDTTSSGTLFNVPDEWVHAIKYAALADLLSSENQIVDPLRAGYAESRYQQSMTFAKDARSIMRLLVNNVPVPIDSLAAIDAGNPYWRNQVGSPQLAGVMYDLMVLSPGNPPSQMSATADVVQSAPIPSTGGAFMPIGGEDLDHLANYCTHVLTFKCGGNEFKQTMSGYDDFMAAVARRKAINAAKIQYLTPLFGVPQAEWGARPDSLGMRQ